MISDLCFFFFSVLVFIKNSPSEQSQVVHEEDTISPATPRCQHKHLKRVQAEAERKNNGASDTKYRHT